MQVLLTATVHQVNEWVIMVVEYAHWAIYIIQMFMHVVLVTQCRIIILDEPLAAHLILKIKVIFAELFFMLHVKIIILDVNSYKF